jgi:hypothetical protein
VISTNQLINFHTHLTLGYNFDQPLDNLPPTLTHLTTERNFKHVDKISPILSHGISGYHCKNTFTINEPATYFIQNLPPKLTHLTTTAEFNEPVDKLPHTLTSQLGMNSTNLLINFHPHSLTSQLGMNSTNL